VSKPKVDDATDALLIIRHIAIDCDSELSAQAHGRPPSDKETLAVLSQSCRNVYEGAFPLVDRIKTALAAAQPATECPACGWQNDQEAMDCEAAYEQATGRKPGDREFLTFRAGWIAGHTRAALPAQGWTQQAPTEPGFYWRSWCRHVSLENVAKCTGDDGWYLGLVDEYGEEEPFEEGGWWMPASVPTPPNAEPGERSGG
jgi:hypothetical protein